MGHLYHAGGGKTLGNCIAGNTVGRGITFKILTNQAGEKYYISEPLPGSTHDITVVRNIGLFGYMPPWHCTADKGYVGLGCVHVLQKKTGEALVGVVETIFPQ